MNAALLLACVAPLLLNCCDRDRNENATNSAASTQNASARAAAESGKVELRKRAMGTMVHLVAYTNTNLDRARVSAALQAALDEMARLESLMSSWRDDSEVSKINDNAGQFVPVSEETLQVIEKSIWAGNVSGGVFDVTFQTMSDVWKFGDAAEHPPKLPPPREVEERRRLIDYRKIEVDPVERRVRIPPRMKLALGGIAKGYIVDRAAKVLRDRKVATFFVQAGGDLYGSGKKPDGSAWTAGIQDPRGPADTYFASIELLDHAFSTAGDYARSFVVEGRRYHHIIDPRTGYPATACRSVTIWAPDALLADAIDDAVFILGPERGLRLVESLQGVGAVIVSADNKVWVSQRLEGKVKLLKPPSEGL